MTTARPTGYDSFTRPVTGDSKATGATKETVVYDDIADGVEALGAELGLLPSGETRDIYTALYDSTLGHNHGDQGGAPLDVTGGVATDHDDLTGVSADDHHTETHPMTGAGHTGTASLALQGEEFSELTVDYTHPVSNTTFANTGLDFDVEANKTYIGHMMLWISASDAGDVKIQLTGPASPTRVRYSFVGPTQTSTGGLPLNLQQNDAAATAFSTSLSSGGAGSMNALYIVQYMIKNGANAGTVALQAAQRVSDATATIIRAGSYLMTKKVD